MSAANAVSPPFSTTTDENKSGSGKKITMILHSPKSTIKNGQDIASTDEKTQDTSSDSNLDVLQAIAKLATSMQDIKVDLKKDIKQSSDDNQEKLKQLETRLMEAQTIKHNEITEDMKKKFTDQDTKITNLDKKKQELQQELESTKSKLTSQSYKLAIVEEQIEEMQSFFKNTTSKSLDTEGYDILSHDIDEAKQIAREALVLANQVEAHGRRWSIRILGLPEPPQEGESIHAAKTVVVNFLKSRLNISHITIEDIDCCHRVGDVIDAKQMMLTRFYSCDFVDSILRRRKNLKASGLVILDDTTYLNRQLLKNL
jgi:chromosome segregation ATPase